MVDNIHALPVKDDPLRAVFEKFKRDVPVLVEMAPYFAQVRYATFVALVESGFTVDQALLLVKDKQ